MAKEHEEGKEHERSGSKKKKLELREIRHRKLPDGSFVHHHVYADHKDSQMEHPPRMMGTSGDLDDVHQHIEDNWGGEQGGEGEEPEGGEQGQGAEPGEGEPGEGE